MLSECENFKIDMNESGGNERSESEVTRRRRSKSDNHSQEDQSEIRGCAVAILVVVALVLGGTICYLEARRKWLPIGKW